MKIIIKTIIIAILSFTFGVVLTYAHYEPKISKQTAQIILYDHIIKTDFPRYEEMFILIGERFKRCQEVSKKMGVFIKYDKG
jgi:hypothetical protein